MSSEKDNYYRVDLRTHRIRSADRSKASPDHGKQTRAKIVPAEESDTRHLHQTQDAYAEKRLSMRRVLCKSTCMLTGTNEGCGNHIGGCLSI